MKRRIQFLLRLQYSRVSYFLTTYVNVITTTTTISQINPLHLKVWQFALIIFWNMYSGPKPSSTTTTTPVEITQNKAVSSSSDSSSHEDVVDPVDLSSKKSSSSSSTIDKTIIPKKPMVAQGNGSSHNMLKRQQQWAAIQPPATATQLVNPTTGEILSHIQFHSYHYIVTYICTRSFHL